MLWLPGAGSPLQVQRQQPAQARMDSRSGRVLRRLRGAFADPALCRQADDYGKRAPCRSEERSEKGSDLVPGGELFAPMPRIPAEDLSIVLSAARSLVAHCRLAAEGVKPALDALGDEA